jgi:nickel transport protein
MRRRICLAGLLAASWFPIESAGHELLHTIERGEVTVVKLRYADGTPFSYESYEIYREDEKIAYQVGHTDAHGRISFVADRSGSWRIRAFSEDGHGADFVIDATRSPDSIGGAGPARFRTERALTGIALLFGLFGLLSLFRRRRSR